jgi:abortive infection bacteriophage resistance protein
LKQAITIPEQINLLKSRKLVFEDELKAEQFLLKNNYYRLSGYWRKYQTNPDNDDDTFINGATFEKIVAIYELDAQLRNLLQKGTGVFEICFRSRFAYYMSLSEPNGQLSYLQQNSYSDKISKNEKLEDLLKKIKGELDRSNEKSLIHYKKIGEDVPIWAAVEILSFSTVSKMYSRWVNKDTVKKTIQGYKIFKDYESARRIIRSLVYLRNLCAHQARIWNREMVVQVTNKKYLQPFGNSKERSLWRIISILMLLLDEINQNNSYSTNVLNLCTQNEDFYTGLIDPTT